MLPKPMPHRMRRAPKNNLNDEAVVNLLASGRLQKRDLDILSFVWETGLVSASQIRRSFFHTVKDPKQSRNAANRRLRWLYQEYFLNRIIPNHRSEAIYFLDSQGARLIRMQQKEDSLRAIHWSAGKMGRMMFQLKHGLGISGTVVQLKEAGRVHNFSVQWMGETHLKLSTAEGWGFIPDGLGILTHSKYWRLPFFLEWDEATETVREINRKIRRYQHYARHEKTWRADWIEIIPSLAPPKNFPPLIFITTGGKKRLRNMLTTVNAVRNRSFDKRLPFFVLMSNQTLINEKGIWGAAFFTPETVTNSDFGWEHTQSIANILGLKGES